MSAEEKAIEFINEFNLGLDFNESGINEIKKAIHKMLKQQDRDTRHACAEACMNDETHTNGRHFHNVCMNAKAL